MNLLLYTDVRSIIKAEHWNQILFLLDSISIKKKRKSIDVFAIRSSPLLLEDVSRRALIRSYLLQVLPWQYLQGLSWRLFYMTLMWYSLFHLHTFSDKYEHSPNVSEEEELRNVCATDWWHFDFSIVKSNLYESWSIPKHVNQVIPRLIFKEGCFLVVKHCQKGRSADQLKKNLFCE